MASVPQLPSALLPMPAVALILSRFDRAKLASFIEVAIGLLDSGDGDPDVEHNGDEQDGSGDEADASWPEWHTRGRHKEAWHNSHDVRLYGAMHEDAEDDDNDSGVEDSPLGFDPEQDLGAEEAGEPEEALDCLRYGIDQSQPLGPGHVAH